MKKNILIITLLITASYALPVYSAQAVPGKAPLTLGECIGTALSQSPRMIIAEEKLNAVRAQKTQAFGTALPSLKISSSYTKMTNPYEAFTAELAPIFAAIMPTASIGTSSSDDMEQYKMAVSFTQILWGAHVLPVIFAADLALKQAENNLQREKQNTALETTKAFFEVLKARRLLGIIAQSAELLSAHLYRVETMKEIGMATEAHVLQTKLQLAQLQQQVIQLDGAVEIAGYAFNNTMGYNLDRPVMLDDRSNISVPTTNIQYLLEKAKVSRPDILSMQKMIKILETNLHLVGSPQWPAIVFTASYDWTDNDRFTYDQDNQNWMWTVAGSWTLFDGWQTPAKVDEAAAGLRQMKKNYEQMLTGVVFEVKMALQNAKVAERKLGAAGYETELAKQNLEATMVRFEHGAGSNLDVLDAQTKIMSAQSTLANTKYDYEVAKAALLNAIGEETEGGGTVAVAKHFKM
ncbi:MAG: TolC family protein [Candidatus Margulisiibacteriota bacterium]